MLGAAILLISLVVAACSAVLSPSPVRPLASLSTASATPLVTPTAAPTFDLAQVKVVALHALAVDGDVIYGDQHIAGSSKYDFVAYNLSTGATRDLGTAASAATVSDGRVVWTTYTVENGAPQRNAIPGCPVSSIAHWRLYRFSPSDAKPSLVAKGDSVRPGLGECADSMAPLIALDGDSVAYTDGLGSGDTITVLDVRSGRRTRTIATSGVVDELAISNGSIAYLEEVQDRTPDFAPFDNQLMLAGASGAPTVVAEHANWFSMAGARVAWMSSGTTTGVVSIEVLPSSSTTYPPNPYSSPR